MTPEEEIVQAGKAKDFLQNPIFKLVFQEVEEALLLGMRQSAFKDGELREKLCQQYNLLHALRDRIQTYLDTGELAAEEIKRRSIAQHVKEMFNG